MCSLKYKKTCFFIPTLKKNKTYGPCNMKVMGYEIAFQITMPFPRANAWNASQDFLYPLRFSARWFPCPHNLIIIIFLAAIICV